jgi:hypothetical protein
MQLTARDPLPPGAPLPPPPTGIDSLAHLGMCLASITPNTASTERVFSQFKVLHSPRRNHLSHHIVRKMTMVKQFVNETHGGPKRKRDDDELTAAKLSSTSLSDDRSSANGEIADCMGFRNIISELINDATENPGISNKDLDLMLLSLSNSWDSAPLASPPELANEQLTIRIPFDSAQRAKRAKMLRFLFPQPDVGEAHSASSHILDDYWCAAEADLVREQEMHEQIAADSFISSVLPVPS